MKKFLCMAGMAMLAGLQADAQLGNILKKTRDKTQTRIDQKIDQSIDKTLDKAEGKKLSNAEKDNSTDPGNTEQAAVSKDTRSVSSFSKFDFIPGDSILYAEDFGQDELGELPLNWNTSGTGEVVTLEGIPGQWLRMHKKFRYLSSNQQLLGENFTLEFDLVLQLKNNGWMYPSFDVAVFASGDEPGNANTFLKRYDEGASVIATLYPGENGSSKARLTSFARMRSHYTSDAKMYEALEKSYFKIVHIAIQVQKERFRMWINSDKIFDAPKAVPAGPVLNQLLFELGSTNYPEEQYGVFVSNIKVATGKPDTRHKLVEEGRFSTTGILFDVQSAVIKPESYAVVKEIASVLKQYPDIKVQVVGHTSSDGDDQANMKLSQQRAAAVRELLISEFRIDGGRIETEGRGETQPVADNATKEGRMANRRVEFIKL